MVDYQKIVDILMDELPEDSIWQGRIQDLADIIAHGDSVADKLSPTAWIPVTERLPDKNMKCLCSYVFGENYDFHFEQVLFYVATCDTPHFQHEGELGLKVTHWMPILPLPTPPKGE